jgi:hypothetical protein
VLDALHVGRPNPESYHMGYTLLCPYLVAPLVDIFMDFVLGLPSWCSKEYCV